MLSTDRLDLVPATGASARAAIENPMHLGALLRAYVPRSWPPELLDVPALEWTYRWALDPANDPAFGMYWTLLRTELPPYGRTLVGVAGYKGMPKEGIVEVGYGVVVEFQRRGFATEATRALVAHAFGHRTVTRVIAETLPGLVPSIGVLEKCGFRFVGAGSEPGVIRYEITRTRTTEHRGAPP